MKLSREELEYSISQYLDGTLPLLERAPLEERLANDPQAREILNEYRALDLAVKSAMPLPEVAWDQLAARIGHSLAEVEAPVRHFSLGRIGWTGRLAIAAVLLFAVSLAIFFATPQSNAPAISNAASTGAGSAVVVGPTIERPDVPAVAEITIGPSPSLAGDWRINQEVLTRPSVVLIDRAHLSGQDNDLMY
jgi:anti-sigma factor RsiW